MRLPEELFYNACMVWSNAAIDKNIHSTNEAEAWVEAEAGRSTTGCRHQSPSEEANGQVSPSA